MSLFRKPTESKKGVKILVYGYQGSGKSNFALSFPNIAAVDTEAGLSFYEGTDVGKNLKLIANTQSYKDLEDMFEEVSENYEELGIKTFLVDSMTKVKENMEETVLEVDRKRARKNGQDPDDTNISVRSRGIIKNNASRLQNIKIDLSSKGVHIVDVAQVKEVQKQVGNSWIVDKRLPDMKKGAEHDYDIVLFFYTEDSLNGETKFYARVEKDRLEVYKTGSIIENPSYENWKKVIESNQKKKALETSFANDVKKSSEAYEEEVEEENKSLKDQTVELLTSLDEDGKTAMKSDLRKAGIAGLADIDRLTSKKMDKLKEILAKYKK